MEITKATISDYLHKHTSLFSHAPLTIEDLSVPSNTQNDGFVNFIFRISQNNKSYILKQARPYLRVIELTDNIADSKLLDELPVERNYLEYLSFQLRHSIASNYVPKVFFVDTANNVFIMEDLGQSHKILRFELNTGKKFPSFAQQIGEFMSHTHFHTSELYLDKSVFRNLLCKFSNVHMRAIMEDFVLLKLDMCQSSNSALAVMGKKLWDDPAIKLNALQVRDNFIKKSECLVHGDLHTSNIFINDKSLGIIDMEYSFMAPYSYDLGYLLANFVSQYAAFTFKVEGHKKTQHQEYLLNTIKQVYDSYFNTFEICYKKNAKPLYLQTEGFLNSLFAGIFQESLGIMALANMIRIINRSPFPDFDCIDDPKNKLLAQGLSLTIDKHLLLNRKNIATPNMLIDYIKKVTLEYTSSILY